MINLSTKQIEMFKTCIRDNSTWVAFEGSDNYRLLMGWVVKGWATLVNDESTAKSFRITPIGRAVFEKYKGIKAADTRFNQIFNGAGTSEELVVETITAFCSGVVDNDVLKRLEGFTNGTFVYQAFRGKAPDGVPQLRDDIMTVVRALKT